MEFLDHFPRTTVAARSADVMSRLTTQDSPSTKTGGSKPFLHLLLAGQGLSLVGTQGTAFAFSVYVLQNSDGIAVWSGILLSGYILGATASLSVGPAVRKWDLRTVLLVGIGLATTSCAALIGLTASGVLSPWMLIITNGIAGAAVGLQEPTYVLTVMRAGSAQSRPRRQASAQTVNAVAFVVAPAAAVALYSSVGLVGVLLVDLISDLTFGGFVAWWVRPLTVAGDEKVQREAGTFRLLARQRSFMIVVAAVSGVNLCLGLRQTLRSPIVLDNPSGGPSVLATVLTVAALSSVVGGILYTFVAKIVPVAVAFTASIVCSGVAGQAAFGWADRPAGWIVASCVISLFAPVLSASGYTLALEGVAEHLQAHAVSIARSGAAIALPASITLAVPFTDLLSTSGARNAIDRASAASELMIISGLAAGVVGVATAVILHVLRQFSSASSSDDQMANPT